MEGLYDELSKQNQILKTYCKLRIESYQLIRKALIENTSYYDAAIQSMNEKIDREVEKLK
jgi:rhomboid protease GluP